MPGTLVAGRSPYTFSQSFDRLHFLSHHATSHATPSLHGHDCRCTAMQYARTTCLIRSTFEHLLVSRCVMRTGVRVPSATRAGGRAFWPSHRLRFRGPR